MIFHDFHVRVSVAKRTSSFLDLQQALSDAQSRGLGPEGEDSADKLNAGSLDLDHHELAVKDLKLAQLHLLHVRTVVHVRAEISYACQNKRFNYNFPAQVEQ